jgi:phage repressor protein C with HTH and peptisase S24 domain
MLKHDDIWRAIDTLATQHGLTASGLARKAGLDPTTFNTSKRITAAGRRRWPSTESLAKALEAVGATLNEFVGLVEAGEAEAVGAAHIDSVEGGRRIPVAAQSAAASNTAFGDTGEPQGAAWSRRQLPEITDPDAYAIVVEGKAYQPVLREGALVVAAPQTGANPGDRVVVRMNSARLILAELVRRGPEALEIRPINGGTEVQTIPNAEIAAVHRIVWAEQ